MITTLLTSVGLVLVFEGLTYALVPSQMKMLMARLQETSVEQLRMMGTIGLAAGVLVVWLALGSTLF